MTMMITDNVLTMKEMASYLKIPEEKIERQVLQGKIPGRRIEDEWRFLRVAIDEWLKNYEVRTILINQSGAFSDDEKLDELRMNIYSERNRSETEDFIE